MHFSLNRYLSEGEELGSVTSSLVRATANIEFQRNNVLNVILQLNIASGWHINANPAGQDNLIPTTVKVNADAPFEISRCSLSEG